MMRVKDYDNRWMHRPVINCDKNKLKNVDGTIENRIFKGTQRLLNIRKKLPAITDTGNLIWTTPHNIHIAGFMRVTQEQQIFCLFNFSGKPAYLTWYAFKETNMFRKNYTITGRRKNIVLATIMNT